MVSCETLFNVGGGGGGGEAVEQGQTPESAHAPLPAPPVTPPAAEEEEVQSEQEPASSKKKKKKKASTKAAKVKRVGKAAKTTEVVAPAAAAAGVAAGAAASLGAAFAGPVKPHTKPKKNVTARMHYQKQNREVFKQQYPNLTPGQLTKTLGEAFAQLPDDMKKGYAEIGQREAEITQTAAQDGKRGRVDADKSFVLV